jgi:hypothetical protein
LTILKPSKIFDDRKGRHIWPQRTICEVHRELYDILVLALYPNQEALLEKIVPLLEEAYIAGLKMNKKLVENKVSLPDWDANLSAQESSRIRKLRIELTEKLKRIEAVDNI